MVVWEPLKVYKVLVVFLRETRVCVSVEALVLESGRGMSVCVQSAAFGLPMTQDGCECDPAHACH